MSLRGHRGLTLLELVVAIAVLAIGTLATVRAVDQSRLSLGEATARTLAHQVARNRIEELRLLGTAAQGLPAEVTMAGQRFSLEVQRRTTAGGLVRVDVTARSALGPGALLVAVLPPPGVVP